MSKPLSSSERGALRALAYEAGGHGTTGDGPRNMHPSWQPHLDALVKRGLAISYPENGILADDPGRTFYEITEEGAGELPGSRRPQ